MDLEEVIHNLRLEKQRLDRVIASLEELQGAPPVRHSARAPRSAAPAASTRAAPESAPVRSGRGRKFMDAADRREVSERMRKYWAARRQQADSATS
jgi:hypothetical protein